MASLTAGLSHCRAEVNDFDSQRDVKNSTTCLFRSALTCNPGQSAEQKQEAVEERKICLIVSLPSSSVSSVSSAQPGAQARAVQMKGAHLAKTVLATQPMCKSTT